MIVLESRNVNYALPKGITHLHKFGTREDSRNGAVLRDPSPVTSVYHNPVERVCFHDWRDANPFFHLIESMWMLAGRDDLESLIKYVSSFSNFSDDGKTVPGAYGKRWRDWDEPELDPHSGVEVGRNIVWSDQLNWVVKRLKKDPNDRRTVIQMWDPAVDPGRADAGGRDVPCNLTALPWAQDGKLNLTVFCRSNDIIWGAYGANAVHFSFLLEYLAARTGLDVGSYWQISNNFHAYEGNWGDPDQCWPLDWGGVDPYARGVVRPLALGAGVDLSDDQVDADFQGLLDEFFELGPRDPIYVKSNFKFLEDVLHPMARAHEWYRETAGLPRYHGAIAILEDTMPEDNDWRAAGIAWLEKRRAKFEENQ